MTEIYLKKLLKNDLLDKCKILGLKNYKSKNKPELIKLIETHSNNIIITEGNNKNNIQNLPNELLMIIRDYIDYKDTYDTYKQYFKTQLNYSLVCKSMYNIFMLNSKKYENMSNIESKELINRKKCINTYGLIENDLDIIYGNKKHRNFRQNDAIYKMVSVIELSYKKYGIYNNFIKIKEQKELEIQLNKEQIENEINNRRLTLINMLKKYKLFLRDDSVLCNNYIYENEGNPEEIVTIMVEMNFYFNCTKYSNLIYNYTSNYVDNARNYSFGYYGHKSLSQYEKNMLSEDAKKDALKKWCNNKKSIDEALCDSKLPMSLHDKVKMFF
jgi:hypothetical protein